jgi:hypothetical protein
MESIAGQKGLRHGSRNMFVFSSRIFDRGWFAGYTLLTSEWLCHNSPLHPPLPALKTSWFTPHALPCDEPLILNQSRNVMLRVSESGFPLYIQRESGCLRTFAARYAAAGCA